MHASYPYWFRRTSLKLPCSEGILKTTLETNGLAFLNIDLDPSYMAFVFKVFLYEHICTLEY